MSGFIFCFSVNAEQELENQDFSLKSMTAKESSDAEFLLQGIWI